jgi:lauroyl/myristoyl acyltransferase
MGRRTGAQGIRAIACQVSLPGTMVSSDLDGVSRAPAPSARVDAARAASRPLVTSRDLAFLIYYYPLRWLARVFGSRFHRVARACAEPVSRILQFQDLRNAERVMSAMLEVPSGRARELTRHYSRNRVRAALFDLRPDAEPLVRLEGREHLEQAQARARGVILVTLHCLAKRQARLGLRRLGIEYQIAVAGRLRFPGHGWLLDRFIQRRLTPWQRRRLGSHIVTTDPDATLKIASILREGGTLLMAPDVITPTAQPVRFMNGSRPISAGALEIARLTGCALVPMWVSWSAGGCVVEFRPALALRSGGNREEARQWNLAVLARALEEQMRAHPEQWEFWDWRTPAG